MVFQREKRRIAKRIDEIRPKKTDNRSEVKGLTAFGGNVKRKLRLVSLAALLLITLVSFQNCGNFNESQGLYSSEIVKPVVTPLDKGECYPKELCEPNPDFIDVALNPDMAVAFYTTEPEVRVEISGYCDNGGYGFVKFDFSIAAGSNPVFTGNSLGGANPPQCVNGRFLLKVITPRALWLSGGNVVKLARITVAMTVTDTTGRPISGISRNDATSTAGNVVVVQNP